MLQASTCLAADDVEARCRVRHSSNTTNREFTEAEDMICTMRIWHETNSPCENAITKPANNNNMQKSRSFGSPSTFVDRRRRGAVLQHQRQQEAELILSSIQNPMMIVNHHHHHHGACNTSEKLGEPVRMSRRFESFGSGEARVPKLRQNVGGGNSSSVRRSRIRQSQSQQTAAAPPPLGNVTIPLSDIMVVDMYGEGECHRTNITTTTNGYFEFTMENRNGQEILLAFLRASLPKERVMGDDTTTTTTGPLKRSASELSHSTTGTAQSFDVEAFTASRMSERLQRESFSEKLRRKVGRVMSSIEEVTSSITDCSCGCGTAAVSPTPVPIGEKRDSPPRQRNTVELSTTDTPVGLERPRVTTDSKSKKRDMYSRNGHMPSGLSVEGAEMESAY